MIGITLELFFSNSFLVISYLLLS